MTSKHNTGDMKKYITLPLKIKIGTPTGENFGTDRRYETHSIKKLELNSNNKYVPYSIETCCGVYVPTSAADGHWENSLHLGDWEFIEES